jgi:hypothetical protein
LPHRGGVYHIKVPIEVATLAVVPLPLALDGDTTILTRATVLEFGGCECTAGERECAADGSGTLPRWSTCPLCGVVC